MILTARLDVEAQSYFDALRRRHFPSERNYLSAHLTLFHALPGTELNDICAQISTVVSQHPVGDARATGLRSLGFGVAFVIECRELMVLRTALAATWQRFLTRQDKQTWHPHITVQNKVKPELARSLLEQLKGDFQPFAIEIEGLDLWHYEGGPWELARSWKALPKAVHETK